MRFQGTIDIRPLTVRGTFGIAWKLVCRRAGALVGYVLVITLITALIIAAALSPIAADLIKAAVSGGDFGDGMDVVVDAVISLLLLGVAALVIALVITPAFNGTLYGELSSRIYADGASCGMLLKRGRYSLKRCFTTAMCLIVCSVAVNMAVSLVSSAVSGAATFTGMFSALPSLLYSFDGSLGEAEGAIAAMLGGSGPALIALLCGVSLFTLAVKLCAQSFLCMTYPVTINENAKNFDAVGRSMKLGARRFGRVLACRVLFELLRFAVYLAAAVLCALAALAVTALKAPDAALGVVIGLTFALTLVIGAVFAAYSPAIDTVLYFDARVRLEGNAFMLPPESAYGRAPSAQQAPEAQAPVQQAPEAEPEFIRNDLPENGIDNNNTNDDGGEHGA